MDIFDIVLENLREEEFNEKLEIVKKIKKLPERTLNRAIKYILKKGPPELERMDAKIKKLEKAAAKSKRKRR